MRLPWELVREIVQDLSTLPQLAVSNPEENGFKAPWIRLDAISQSSKAFRTLVLEVWFRGFVVRTVEDLRAVKTHHLPIELWVRLV